MNTMPLFETGGTFPRVGDIDRLERYAEADKLFHGNHKDLSSAKRIREKLEAQYGVNAEASNHTIESVVWITLNLPRLICTKFADLMLLNQPIIDASAVEGGEELLEEMADETPELWDDLHYAMQIARCYGDAVLLPHRAIEDGPVEVRVCSPMKWYPVLDPNDDQRVLMHQIAWVEPMNVGGKDHDVLRVDILEADRIERRAFVLDGVKAEGDNRRREIREELDIEQYFEGLEVVSELDLGGHAPCIHLRNGRIKAGSIFGRPEFLDSMALIDNINWRLSTWSDANDRVSHQAEIVDKNWVQMDEDGTVLMAPRFRRRYLSQNSRTADSTLPQFVQYPLDFETLVQEWERSVKLLCVRHEMAPALLGVQVGAAQESAEAREMGMGTTEAATRRTLQSTESRVNRLLTLIARMKGRSDGRVTAHFSVGLPKSHQQMLLEIAEKMRLGLMTREDALRELYPWMDEGAVQGRIERLDTEARNAVSLALPDFEAEIE